jgi:hypothetical protein
MNRVIVGLAVAAVFGACSSDNLVAIPGLLNKLFGATMIGANEKPNAVTTTATGTANITVIDSNTVRVQTLVTSIDSVTQAHIHAGDANTAGPVMVFLAGTYPASQNSVARGAGGAVTLSGVLSHVDIVRGATTFLAPFTFDSLITRINAGTAYVNVHTKKNPGGEIRGPIVPK